MENKNLIVSVQAAKTLPLDSLENFQGELKTISKDEYEKLKSSLSSGIKLALHVWEHEGHNYLIDGHQRVFTMRKMRDEEGWIIPEIPVVLVQAASMEDAKKTVLMAISQHGKYTEKSLFDYVQENKLDFSLVVGTCSFPEIDMAKFTSMFHVEPVPDVNAGGTGEGQPPTMKSTSDGVKQVQLFFDADTHQEFMTKVNELSVRYGKENITDTVIEVIREAHSRQ